MVTVTGELSSTGRGGVTMLFRGFLSAQMRIRAAYSQRGGVLPPRTESPEHYRTAAGSGRVISEVKI